MSCWLTIPSARPPEEAEKVLSLWRKQGYKIALYLDPGKDGTGYGPLNLTGVDVTGYPGYAVAVNRLIEDVIKLDSGAEWFVIGGDDVHPDMNHTAEEIAGELKAHFSIIDMPVGRRASTFGVMQPTGDRWGENPNHPNPAMRSAYIDRIAGSGWLGREFSKRVNGGRGPLWSGNPSSEDPLLNRGYSHMFVDEELRSVAVKLGIYWERRDLIHHHAHPGRRNDYTEEMIPEHLKKWTIGEEGREHWKESQALYFARRDAKFPGSEPI